MTEAELVYFLEESARDTKHAEWLLTLAWQNLIFLSKHLKAFKPYVEEAARQDKEAAKVLRAYQGDCEAREPSRAEIEESVAYLKQKLGSRLPRTVE